MQTISRILRAALFLLCVFSLLVSPAEAKKTTYKTGFAEWLAKESNFSGWTLSGARLNANGALELNPLTAAWETDPYAPGTYYEGNFYNGGSYWVGEAVSPAVPAGFDFDELIPSWNAVTPPGTWVEILVRAELSGRWTKWYNLGVWASSTETIQRHSVSGQGDTDATASVDTLVIKLKRAVTTAYQLKVRLFSEDGSALPSVHYLSAATSIKPPTGVTPSAGNPAYWNTLIAVPECSQMVYPGGNVWCSATSTAMIVSYWMGYTGACEPAVMAAVNGVYDFVYDGTGNWTFNTAYAGSYGLNASVRRFTSMEQIEYWVAQGVPVAFSYAWNQGELTGAAVESSAGHLSVIVGFDGQGNPIVNDPAAATDDNVQRTYLRAELEPLWLENSGGVVYLIKE